MTHGAVGRKQSNITWLQLVSPRLPLFSRRTSTSNDEILLCLCPFLSNIYFRVVVINFLRPRGRYLQYVSRPEPAGKVYIQYNITTVGTRECGPDGLLVVANITKTCRLLLSQCRRGIPCWLSSWNVNNNNNSSIISTADNPQVIYNKLPQKTAQIQSNTNK